MHVSRRLAEELAAENGNAIWANQFDNLANREGHRMTTGQEIWDQTGGRVDAFTCACGTGGTLAGVSLALKARNSGVRIVLADPHGSGLYGWVKNGDLTVEGSSITEGIGQSRVPDNLSGVEIDDAERIPDAEALEQIFRRADPRGPVGGDVVRDQYRGGDQGGEGDGAGPHGGDDPMRWRIPVSVETVQPIVPAGEGFAGAEPWLA